MTTSIISTFDNSKIARQAMGELLKAGFKDQDLEILQGDADEIRSEIVELGFGRDEAKSFAEAAGRGKTLLVARTDDRQVEKVSAIMERFESSEDEATEGEQTVVRGVEEELSVGKRTVANSGVRVTTKVTETPVEETVTLREEEVEANRKPVSRKASPDELDAAFEEKTVEMIGTSEEIEVGKEARVVEEVALGKKTKEHEETVQDSVRRSKVEIEKIEPKSRKTS